jgi:DivIVA domain-containing protein
MSDEIFQVTAHDIRGQEFQRVMRGYDPNQVESFKQRMAEEFDRVLRERVALDERLKNLVEQLRQYRDRERAMNDALVAAQQLRVDIQAQAGREADLVLKEAQAEAARIIERAEAEELAVQQRSEAAVRQYAAYLRGFRALLARHGAELTSLEAYLAAAEEQPGDEPELRASA